MGDSLSNSGWFAGDIFSSVKNATYDAAPYAKEVGKFAMANKWSILSLLIPNSFWGRIGGTFFVKFVGRWPMLNTAAIYLWRFFPVKMMKAPGRNYCIPRVLFERDPSSYFRYLRGGGGGWYWSFLSAVGKWFGYGC